MKETTKQAFSVAIDAVKQLITLSTGVLALTVTFNDKVLGDKPHGPYWLLIVALICHLCSICCGIFALYGVANTMENADEDALGEPTILTPEIKNPARLQILSFVFGLSFLVMYPLT